MISLSTLLKCEYSRFRFAFIVAFVLSLTACTIVPTQQISQQSSEKLEGKSVVVVREAPSLFAAVTISTVMMAKFGASAYADGQTILNENGVEDPAVTLAASLGGKLEAAKHMKVVALTGVAKSDDMDAVLATRADSDFVLDVKTLDWMFSYYPTNWQRYRVTYKARMRLVDVASKAVVAEAGCRVTQADADNPPSEDQLLENKAGLLKTYLQKAAAACADTLARDALKL